MRDIKNIKTGQKVVVRALQAGQLKQGFNALRTMKDFKTLKEHYDKIKNTLKQKQNVTDIQAISIMNYALNDKRRDEKHFFKIQQIAVKYCKNK